MPYLECDRCGGYYELQKGESVNDFDVCQCGGDLKYYASLQNFLDDSPSSYHQSNSNTHKNRNDFDFGNNQYDESSYSLGASSYRGSLSKNYGFEQETSNRKKISKPGFLGRVSFVGLFTGLCITLSGCFISYILFFDYLYSTVINVFSSTGNIMTTISVLGFAIYGILFVISVGGSATATFISGSRSYGDGLLNGIIMGLLIVSAAALYVDHLAGMSLALMSTLVLGSIFVSLTSFGGFTGIALRKMMFRS